MFKTIRKQRLFFRTAIYTLAMALLAMLFVAWWPWFGESPSGKSNFLIPWLVCYGAGLASMVIIEPFRHPKGSPYGFLLGSAARTAPPLLLVIAVLVAHRPVDRVFWISLLFSYFLMLVLVMMLTIPAHQTPKSGESEADPEKKEKKIS